MSHHTHVLDVGQGYNVVDEVEVPLSIEGITYHEKVIVCNYMLQQCILHTRQNVVRIK